jgi:hypothetical protein
MESFHPENNTPILMAFTYSLEFIYFMPWWRINAQNLYISIHKYTLYQLGFKEVKRMKDLLNMWLFTLLGVVTVVAIVGIVGITRMSLNIV